MKLCNLFDLRRMETDTMDLNQSPKADRFNAAINMLFLIVLYLPFLVLERTPFAANS